MKAPNFITFLLFFIPSFLVAQEWVYDFEEAKHLASSENKSILLVFSGSDWCAPCIKLEKKIWNTSDFIAFANQSLVLLKADFPRRKSNELSAEQTLHNNQLAETYNKNGYFPLVLILNSDGDTLGVMGYEKASPKEYINKIKALF